MGIYATRILPRLIHLAMRSPVTEAERAQLVPMASGRVLEVGIGSGLNLPFYGSTVDALFALDPSLELWALGAKRRVPTAFPIQFVRASASEIPMRGGSFETVVMTFTLCSVPDPAAALREVRRVLRPDGRLIFVEHGRSPDARVSAWQDRLTPVWRRVAGGCHLNRKIDELIRAAGFAIIGIETGHAEAPKLLSYLVKGAVRLDRPSSGVEAAPSL